MIMSSPIHLSMLFLPQHNEFAVIEMREQLYYVVRYEYSS